jgi:hypothetical protein
VEGERPNVWETWWRAWGVDHCALEIKGVGLEVSLGKKKGIESLDAQFWF